MNSYIDRIRLTCIKFSTSKGKNKYKNKNAQERSRERHNIKPQPFPDTKRKRKQTKPNMRKSKQKRTKNTKISSLFPKRGNRNAQRTKQHKNKITPGKTLNKSPRRINHKAAKSKTKQPQKEKKWREGQQIQKISHTQKRWQAELTTLFPKRWQLPKPFPTQNFSFYTHFCHSAHKVSLAYRHY